jgi:hypothetical protein
MLHVLFAISRNPLRWPLTLLHVITPVVVVAEGSSGGLPCLLPLLLLQPELLPLRNCCCCNQKSGGLFVYMVCVGTDLFDMFSTVSTLMRWCLLHRG